MTDSADIDLRYHGDAELTPGLVDLAVNVRGAAPPEWLLDELRRSVTDLAAYPDQAPARQVLARWHDCAAAEVLPTAGAAEAFTLIARMRRWRRPVVIHPQFTEPEAALAAAGCPVQRVLLEESTGFTLRPSLVPDDADLVVVGNPTNPTSVLHSAATVAALARPGRIVLVDEAFMDAVPGEPQTLTGGTPPAGIVVVRSLTKTWALAGLRVGFLIAAAEVVAEVESTRAPWTVSTPALAAVRATCSPRAVFDADRIARTAATERDYLQRSLADIDGVDVLPAAAAPFVLARVDRGLELRADLRRAGFAVRRCDTFPGLGPDWLRVAARPADVVDRLAAAIRAALAAR